MTSITDFALLSQPVCRFEGIICNRGYKPPAISVIKVIEVGELLPNFVAVNFGQFNIPYIFV